jgi:chromosome segregation and condensation protein ScpB
MFQLETVLMAKSLKLILESMLYAAEKPLSAREIHSIIPERWQMAISSGAVPSMGPIL